MMRIRSSLIALAILLLVITVACSDNGSDDSSDQPAEVAGPALVMFYTDN
jgi:hypothetical protein